MTQVMHPAGFRADPRYCDGGAGGLHMALGLFGKRALCIWEKQREEPRALAQRCGDACISNPGAFEHQRCNFGSHVFSENRSTTPPAKPIVAYPAASAVRGFLAWTAAAKPRACARSWDRGGPTENVQIWLDTRTVQKGCKRKRSRLRCRGRFAGNPENKCALSTTTWTKQPFKTNRALRNSWKGYRTKFASPFFAMHC